MPTPPADPIIALPKELSDIANEQIIISGRTEPHSRILASVGDKKKETKADQEGNFEVKSGLVLGANTISVKAVDEAGNESKEIKKEIEFNPTKIKVKVTRVIDGDTIAVERGDKIRYIGIDTPETGDCFSQEATRRNKELVEGKEILVEKDISEVDKYGRLLRYVWVGDMFVNEQLVRDGYAQVSTQSPDVKYSEKFLKSQQEAREQNKGLWGNVCGASTEITADSEPTAVPTNTTAVIPPTSTPVETEYTCNCSKTCGQMTSCEEAYFQLNTCGCSARDGDNDGVPCESICPEVESAPLPTNPPDPNESGGGGYTCDCSKTCGEMFSCDEAYYQLNQCGCSRRDGDNDGVPCESICD